jgi:hypothetical protein
MKPEGIAELILEGHLSKKPTILDIPNFRLDLQLDYSGLMAKGAYKRWKKRRNEGRRKVGCFDFKIFRLVGSGEVPMTHRQVVMDVGKWLDKEAVNRIFRGEAPLEMICDDDVKVVLQEAQLAMLEQEVNWGEEPFQSWSKFPPSQGKRPRDFVTAYFRRIFEEPGFLKGARKRRAASGTWNVLPPPLNKREWGNYLEPKESPAKPWLRGMLLERFRRAAESMPDNPEYERSY